MQVKAGRFEMMDKGLAGPCAAYCIYLSRMSTSQTSIGGACIPLVITEHSPTVLLYSTRESVHTGLCTSAHRVHTVHMWMPEYHCFKKVRHQEECVWGGGGRGEIASRSRECRDRYSKLFRSYPPSRIITDHHSSPPATPSFTTTIYMVQHRCIPSNCSSSGRCPHGPSLSKQSHLALRSGCVSKRHAGDIAANPDLDLVKADAKLLHHRHCL